MIQVVTESGSLYEVDTEGKRVRALARSGNHRIGPEWKPYEQITYALGQPMWVHWGSGRDEFSPDDGLPDEPRVRMTHTSPIRAIEEVRVAA